MYVGEEASAEGSVELSVVVRGTDIDEADAGDSWMGGGVEFD